VQRKTLLISTYQSDRRAWNGVCYEFLNTVRQVEDATVVAPEAATPVGYFGMDLVRLLRAHGTSFRGLLREASFLRKGGLFQPTRVEGEYDLCLYMCQFLRDLRNIERVARWRESSRFAAAYILESWTGRLEAFRSELKVLDRFDHVFVLNADAVEEMRRYTSTPVSFLPTGADCMIASPDSKAPPRVIDVLSYGRRLNAPHRRMVDLARERGWFYHYDVWGGLEARDWAEVRQSNAALVQRSRYFMLWDPASVAGKARLMQNDRALTTRYFEAAAGGAILLGSRTASPEFDTLFDWPDALVEIAHDGSDLADTLDALEADPLRCAEIRHDNITFSLHRHDWVYRWQQILAAFDLAPTEAHHERVAALAARAAGLGGNDAARRRGRPRLIAEGQRGS
jgi:hypothetical protein